MERAEAEAIYDAGREAVVEVLLAMDRRIQQLETRVEKLERQLTKSSCNSSLPPRRCVPPLVTHETMSSDKTGREEANARSHRAGQDQAGPC